MLYGVHALLIYTWYLVGSTFWAGSVLLILLNTTEYAGIRVGVRYHRELLCT